MNVHFSKLQNKQAFLFRLVDIANELFAMAASVSRADALRKAGAEEAKAATELADLHCRNARRTVRGLFRDLWSNDDAIKYKRGVKVLDGRYAWMEEGAMDAYPPANWSPAEPEVTTEPATERERVPVS